MMHSTTRNIVKATSIGNSLDVTFGPSDDDFHYQKHHATISHQEIVPSAKQLGVKLVFQGGGCEVQWNEKGHAGDDYHYNYVNLDDEGKLYFPWTRDDECPFHMEIDGNRVRIWACEAGIPSEDKYLVFDSETVNVEDH